ncbi:MAG: hypothetical protein KC502_06395 [Myxococcales bacterium]|nr:hypothetical protein [Myxococcales bacterium]
MATVGLSMGQAKRTDVRPGRLAPADGARLSRLFKVLAQVRQRIWLQRTASRAVRLLALGTIIAASQIVLIRAGTLTAAMDADLELGALIAVGLGLVWGAAHRLGWRASAHLLDKTANGYDRAATALDLVGQPADPAWVSIQAERATTWAEQADLQRALPWSWPRGTATLLIAIVCAALSFLVPQTLLLGVGQPQPADGLALSLPAGPRAFTSAADLLGADALTLLREDAAMLETVAQQVEDLPTKRWLKKVTTVIRQVERGELDKRDALARLAKLEQVRPGAQDKNGSDSDPKDTSGDKVAPQSAEQRSEQERQADRAVSEKVVSSLKEAIKSAPKGAMRDMLKAAAEKKDLGLMGKMLEKLALKAQNDMGDKELSKWMKVAEKFAKNLGDYKVPKKFDKLQRRVRRLQDKRRKQGGLGQADRRRLQSHRRSLQQLRKKHGDVQAAKYQLKRLQKEAKRAASELRRSRQQASRLKRKRGKRAQRQLNRQKARQQTRRSLSRQMRRASSEMRRQGRQQRSRQARRIGQRRLRDLRDTLRRSGKRNTARKDFERRARRQAKRSGKQRTHKRLPNKPSQDQSRKAAEQRAKARKAQGQRGQSRRKNKARGKFRLGQGDMPDRTRMRMMRQQGKPGQGQGRQPGQGQQPGQSAGGPNQGRRKAMAAARTEKVKGTHGEGPSIKNVFTEAAKRGFAKRGWQKVYADYSEVAEEMMESEGLPVGRKALVKRYFELIRPR